MRVGVLLEQALAPVPGGSGRYSVELTGALARSASASDSVTGWTAWHRDIAAAEQDGVPVRKLPLPRRPLSLAWERGLGPSPSQPDVLHAPTLLFPPRKRPVVVSIHDAVAWTHPETLTRHGARWHRRMGRLAARHAAAVTVLTRSVADELLNRLPELDESRIAVLGAGVSAQLREPVSDSKRAELRHRFGLPEQFVLAVATLEPRKGLDVLVAAMAELGADAPTLVVVGQPGWGGVDLRTLAAGAGLPADRLVVTGRLADPDLAALLQEASALVMPSRAEGFGLPVAEAMAAGTPVICTDAPALVEVAGDAGLVVPRGDAEALAAAIAALLDDGALQDELAEAGLQQAARHTWDAVADRAWELFRRLA